MSALAVEKEERVVNFTGEAYLRSLHPHARTMGWLALLRYCTCGQLARYMFNGDVEAAFRHLEYMKMRRWIGSRDGINLPKGNGAGRGWARIYYLTETGARALKSVHRDLAEIADPGRPEGVKLARIPHEIVLTESYLYWMKEGYEILEFIPEPKLRSIMFKLAREAGEVVDTERIGNAMGDYEILLYRNEPGQGTKRLECEIAINYSSRKIRTKAPGMTWFACDTMQAKSIRFNAKVEPILLGSVSEPRPENEKAAMETRRPQGLSSSSLKNLLEAMERLGGIVTAEGVRPTLGLNRSQVSRTLAKATRKGHLKYEDISLFSHKAGRPPRLYMPAGHKEITLNEQVHRVILSKLSAIKAMDSYTVREYNPKSGFATLAHDTDKDAPVYLCAVDDPGVPVEEFRELITRGRSAFTGHNKLIVAAMADESRIERLKQLCADLEIWNVLSMGIRSSRGKKRRAPRHVQQSFL